MANNANFQQRFIRILALFIVKHQTTQKTLHTRHVVIKKAKVLTQWQKNIQQRFIRILALFIVKHQTTQKALHTRHVAIKKAKSFDTVVEKIKKHIETLIS